MVAFLHEETLLVTRPGEALPALARISIPGAACVADDGRARVACCTRPVWERIEGSGATHRLARGGSVQLHRFDASGGIAHETTLELDGGSSPVCALFHGDVLFVAGQVEVSSRFGVGLQRPFLSLWDLAAPGGPARFDVPLGRLPDKTFDKRVIDALAVDGDRLLAFDNVMRPVYVFIFDLADPRRPAWREARDVTSGLWAAIAGVAVGSRFVAAIQTQGSRSGPTYTVMLLERASLKRVAAMSARPGTTRLPTFRAMAIVDDVLFLASATRGLGRLDLRRLADLRPLKIDDDIDAYLAEVDAREARLELAVDWSLALGADVLDVRSEGNRVVALARGEDGELYARAFDAGAPFPSGGAAP
jgi:hypothetical protein